MLAIAINKFTDYLSKNKTSWICKTILNNYPTIHSGNFTDSNFLG
jgi:hypothetical protein